MSRILADPATFAPYSCTVVEQYSFKGHGQLGWIDGLIYWPLDGRCRSSGPPPEGSPVVLLMHGQGYDMTEYAYLATHPAANGFVVASVSSDAFSPPLFCGAPAIMCIEDRARKGVSFLSSMENKWEWKDFVDFQNVAVVGHSQGGEAAVEAAKIIRWEEDQLGDPGVNAVVSLAPSDIGGGPLGRRQLVGRESRGFLVLYGSRDEDIGGWNDAAGPPLILPHQTGFALYDRAGTAASLEGIPISFDAQITKAMWFIYEANHRQFSDRCGHGACDAGLDCDPQQHLAKGFVNAFLRWFSLGEDAYKIFFTGDLSKPWGVDSYPQYSTGTWGARRVIDNFQENGWTSTIGGIVVESPANTLEVAIVDNAQSDPNLRHGPEDGKRLRALRTGFSLSDTILWEIPPAGRDVSSFKHFSFRVGQEFGADAPASLKVRIQSGGGWPLYFDTSFHGEIPVPDYYTGQC